MAVLLNFKICDNAKECGGIAVCSTGALSWNEEKETIEIDNEKCISCRACEKECPIGAFTVAKNEEEYKKIQKEIDDDPRTTKDLFVDRYGAVAISDFFKIELEEIKEKVRKDCLTLIEIYNPDIAECLLKSIPIKELTKNLPKDTLFYKVESSENVNEYGVKELPSLLVFKSGKLIGHIDGYYNIDDKEIVLSRLNDILK
ncbi:MAG: 4Fe-4S dicluster domain-containing protein [Clostridia bacterium]|jgi:Fe-S-cluster-containing dehydrogenase component|nr:4Fe-4S dicluster domain-containing protein [Clostridia bacterium]